MIRLHSFWTVRLPLSKSVPPERGQQKWDPVLRPAARQIKRGRMTLSPNRCTLWRVMREAVILQAPASFPIGSI